MIQRHSRRAFLALCASTCASAAAVPAAAALRELDIPFVATPHALVGKMLDLARVGAEDHLIDLGCGDGRIPVAAARRGARALGVDLDPLRIHEAAAAARIAGVQHLARFRRQDLLQTPIFEASVVALYLLPEVNLQLRPRLLTELKPGARIVSHAFDMADWRPDRAEVHDGRRIFLWIVPDVAGGRWEGVDRAGARAILEIEQRFQQVEGTWTRGGSTRSLTSARLCGSHLDFAVAEEVAEESGLESFSFRIDGARMYAVAPRPGEAEAIELHRTL